ncbi:MAG TPA: AmmeMemoRadiSam system protein B [Candidatus Saccharimonadales bacterium]|nr:AmmeMemoRadiSam system protein B [Candidatus Saccharimonadales bacterium]
MELRPSIAGTWYPDSPRELIEELDEYLEAARAAGAAAPAGGGAGTRADAAPGTRAGAEGATPAAAGGAREMVGLMSPHAGLCYSGPVAAHAYARLRGTHPELVALVGPLHSGGGRAVMTSAYQAFGTPLGAVPVDSEAAAALSRALHTRAGRGLEPVQDAGEHSLEIQLPFLQRVLGEFRLLPVMLTRPGAATVEALGHALADVLRGRPALLVASSDLSHFFPQDDADRLDRELLRRVAAFDPAAVLSAEAEEAGQACGAAAVAAVMWAARDLGADRATVLRHASSGDVTGDFHSVVGYAAAAFWRPAAGAA